ncbi:MAG: M6 family metalloprotease domain-containing protein [Elusimicrobia bacterium]|nr:M6 family metalloprotease domain-containing protein [Elusimicrobiota bacterium]
MKKYFIVLLFFVIFLSADFLFAAPPINWEWRKENPNIANTERTMTAEQLKSLEKVGAVRAPGKLGLTPPTTKQIIVVRVQFSDKFFLKDMAAGKTDAEVFFQQMRDYFGENSYTLFTASATVSASTYTLSAISNYNHETDADYQRLLTDTVNISSGDINYALYDHIMIFHAGQGQEMHGTSEDIWSAFYPMNFSVNGKSFNGFTVVPELAPVGTSPLGVICHEYGHQLGLPDIYDTSVLGGKSVCGTWTLMDYPYGVDNTGINPPHLDPWCKNYLGFLDLSSRIGSTANSALTWNSIETSQPLGFYKLPIEVASSSEYFVAEYRNTTAAGAVYDKKIPGTGLVIWHIDDAIASNTTRLSNNDINSGKPHLGIDLVEANGSFVAPGQASNAFVSGDNFTTPLSNSFEGIESGISIAGILITGGSASGTLAMISAESGLNLKKLINYPNPAGIGYSHPRSSLGIITTIVLKASRPPRELELTLYDLAGEKIKSVTKDKIALKVDKSKDYNWFYEYDWDGKNEDGKNVAPGIYLYRIKADNETSVGKLAIVR